MRIAAVVVGNSAAKGYDMKDDKYVVVISIDDIPHIHRKARTPDYKTKNEAINLKNSERVYIRFKEIDFN